MTVPSPAAVTDWAPGLERLFDQVPAEGSWEISAREGEVPAFVRGSYYLIGPARFARGDLRYRHWLDGDGLVTALAFGGRDGDGGVRLTQRFVRSAKLVDEEAAGRPLYRAFGTAFPGDQLVRGVALASPVNVSVYPFAGNLLAFGEQGLPWRLDPVTLETVGEHTFGRLNPVSPFSAHPSFDLVSGEMTNFGISFSATQPLVHLYRFGADGALRDRRRLPLDAPSSLHDFGLSRRYAVLYVNPYLLDVAAMIERGTTVLEALSWQPERGSRLLVVDLERGDVVASVPIGARYCLHHVNCYEEGDRLIVDVLELEEPVYPDYQVVPDLFTAVAPAHPVRLVVDLARGELAGREELPYRLAADFPSGDPLLNGRPYHRFWMLAISATGRPGRKFLDQLVAVDWRQGGVAGVYQAPPGRYLGGEPIFIGDPAADPAGDDRPGVVIVQELEPASRRTDFLLFDAADVARGPIARLPLPGPIPPCFHASWSPA
jgi:all-trans-8'-apo-beta-carotenal 15,15'-oxygenase